MNKIPTAEEYLNSKVGTRSAWITEMMIEFAKLHVEAALKAASKNADVKLVSGVMDDYRVIDEDTILKSYPLENIK